MEQHLKKYKIKLNSPLDSDIETELFSEGVLPYGEWGEIEIVVKTFKTKEELLRTDQEVQYVTEELSFTEDEVQEIELLKLHLKTADKEEFLKYYYLTL